MKKKLLKIILLVMLLFQVKSVSAACISSLDVKGVSYRTNGHQNQCLTGYVGSYSTSGTGTINNASCISISQSSIVNVRVNGNTFCFSPQAHGNADVTISVKASCSCSGSAISKTIHFNLSEWGLRSLEVVGYSLSPVFYNGTFNYTVTVPKNVNSIEIKATPNQSDSKMTGLGVKELTNGENKFTINVTTPQGNSKNYYVTVVHGDTTDTPKPSSSSSSSTKPSSSQTNSNTTTPKPSSNQGTTTNNPETGPGAMFIVWISGIFLAGYMFWYHKASKNIE